VLVLGGLVAGLPGALAAGRLLQGLLAGIAPIGPAALSAVAALVLVVAAAATLIPARRALRIDPVVALRAE
jgi:ABC-type antimicrobial peptide transport system permease subunit